ncbi:hypothetical protein CDD83_2259 [Cordyceps sp. RAO-2017]|nr:hypothetical protein CDD83_2259 [Cordyceps sp. RAO-2017]
MASATANNGSEASAQQQQQPETFKQQLDRAAVESKRNEDGQGERPNPIVEKIAEYIPAASSMLGVPGTPEPAEQTRPDVPGPPNRPDHDHKIEDFVRDQHRSNTDGGMLNTAEADT